MSKEEAIAAIAIMLTIVRASGIEDPAIVDKMKAGAKERSPKIDWDELFDLAEAELRRAN